ncbi:hypothetical protein B0O99DRAFT_588480 [Bisporella sp. PMI_857]|nr:hypothetical protein B0O99DRAFT_588480 [Bisporella sp. PMI_857]
MRQYLEGRVADTPSKTLVMKREREKGFWQLFSFGIFSTTKHANRKPPISINGLSLLTFNGRYKVASAVYNFGLAYGIRVASTGGTEARVTIVGEVTIDGATDPLNLALPQQNKRGTKFVPLQLSH